MVGIVEGYGEDLFVVVLFGLNEYDSEVVVCVIYFELLGVLIDLEVVK